MSEILIYEESGKVSVDVLLENDSVWMSLAQLSQLFERDKTVIAKHLKKIFSDKELDPISVAAKFAVTASDGKIYQVDHFNLDAIISIGYRVNSKRGIQFRQWANKVLKNHLLEGYTLNQKKLLTKGLSELESSLSLLTRTIKQAEHLSDISQEAVRIIQDYARSWKLLLQYDERDLTLPQSTSTSRKTMDYVFCLTSIANLKQQLQAKGEAAEIFGRERDSGLQAILGNLEQTFGETLLYPTVEQTAAHLLYFVIKDHPFTDGNKRIGSFLFILYLRINGIDTMQINEVTLVALALLVAESRPIEKDLVIPLIINLIS